MNKSSLLSILTVGALAVTTLGTYAAWDKIEAENSGTVTFKQPVTVEAGSFDTLTEKSDRTLGTTPTAEGTATFTVSNNDANLAKSMIIKPSISGGTASISDFTIQIKDSTGNLVADNGTDYKDTTLDSTTYTVVLTPKEESVSKIAGQEITVTLQATLSAEE